MRTAYRAWLNLANLKMYRLPTQYWRNCASRVNAEIIKPTEAQHQDFHSVLRKSAIEVFLAMTIQQYGSETSAL